MSMPLPSQLATLDGLTKQEYSRMTPENNTRTWQWITLSLIIFMAVATAYMVAFVAGVVR